MHGGDRTKKMRLRRIKSVLDHWMDTLRHPYRPERHYLRGKPSNHPHARRAGDRLPSDVQG